MMERLRRSKFYMDSSTDDIEELKLYQKRVVIFRSRNRAQHVL